MRRLLIIIAVSFFSTVLPAQNSSWMHYLEELAENDDTNGDYIENLYEELSYLSEHPFNIQTLDKHDLERLPFLTATQIENLLYYIYRYSPIVDIHELKNVEDFDRQTIEYLLPFIYVGKTEFLPDKPTAKNIWKLIKHETSLGTNFTVQEKAGYKKVSQEEKSLHPNRYYLGSSQALSFRYNLNYKDKIQFGLTGKKNAGEIFWSEQQKGFEHYAVSLTFKDLGNLKTLVFGNYHLSFGEGLVMNNFFSMGKTSNALNINQKNTGIRRDASANESRSFNGVAGTLKFNKLEASLFFSYRRPDATADSSTIRSFKTDDYHRTINDIQKKNNSEVNLAGTNIQWKSEYLSVGATVAYYSFGYKELNPKLKPYNLYYLRGREHANAGINYSFYRRNFMFQGETAMDKSGKMASINNLSFTPASFISWTLSYRYYMKDYNALYSKAFSESSTVQNESGLYCGMKLRFLRRLELAGYWDYFSFPWLKHEIDAPSSGNDFLAQLSYNTSQNIQMSVRYRWKEKYKNQLAENTYETAVLPYSQHLWRYVFDYKPNEFLAFKTQFDCKLFKDATAGRTGWGATQTFSLNPEHNKFQLNAGIAYFSSPEWDTRISLYEKNVLHAFTFSTYYGEGLRYYALIKWKIARPLTVYLKAASTHYFDRDAISSGLERIEGKEKSDIYFLVKYRF
ncbi:MAG: helix-hairpin-helix domain-containing protein [Dysgonamonadaceae bacterium]|jgi:hypothetical protein|nr:helix-hairpin-helix domain-containing protein [Dysgonamonadaceae bacterium]